MTDPTLLQNAYELDMRDVFTRMFSLAERWHARSKAQSVEIEALKSRIAALETALHPSARWSPP